MRARMITAAAGAAALYLMIPEQLGKGQTVAYLIIYYVMLRLILTAAGGVIDELRGKREEVQAAKERRRRSKAIDFKLCADSGCIVLKDENYVLREVK